MYKTSIVCVIVTIILTLNGCSQTLVRGDAQLYEIDISRIPDYTNSQDIQLINAFKSPRLVTLTTNDGITSGDLQQLTQTSIELLQNALGKRSINATLLAKKKIVMQLHHIRFHVGYWVRRTTLKLDAKLSSGKTIIITADYRSPGDSFRALNGTIRKAVEQLMKHKDFIQYINS